MSDTKGTYQGEAGNINLFGETIEDELEPLKSAFDSDIIQQLKDRRYSLGVTQDYMNHKIGCADRLINKWECGTRLPSAFSLWCWVTSLGGRIQLVWEDDDV